MKKLIIGALVASLILFIWQFLSWSMLGVHSAELQHTDKQDEIMEVLNGVEEGTYYLPNVPAGTSSEDRENHMKESMGKPWAQIHYQNQASGSMGMNMFRGWVIDFISALILCWILMNFNNLNMKNTLLVSLGVGIIGYLTIDYLGSIWFATPAIPGLIDTIAQWGLTGLWLGFWLTRE